MYSYKPHLTCINVLSEGLSFGWITPLMKQGYRKPITEKDVWKLDKWDETETLNEKYAFSLLIVYGFCMKFMYTILYNLKYFWFLQVPKVLDVRISKL